MDAGEGKRGEAGLKLRYFERGLRFGADEVDLRSATYTVSVHEATTGKELGTTELEGTDDSKEEVGGI